MENPLVTIYITNRNYGAYLEKAIQSSLNQTYKNIEIIIVDDSSNDSSHKILKRFKKYNKVRIIKNIKKKGLVKSSLKAIKLSKGDFILRLDADDFLNKDAIKLMINKIKNKRNYGLIFCDYYNIDSKSKVLSRYKYKHKKKYTIMDTPAHGACSLINKKNYLKIGGYNNLFDRQDGYYLWILMNLNDFKILHLQKPLFFYRKHGKNLSNDKLKILKTRFKIIHYLLQKKNVPQAFFLKKLLKQTKKKLVISRYELF